MSETMPQLIGLSESYMLVYERKDVALSRSTVGGGGGGGASSDAMET